MVNNELKNLIQDAHQRSGRSCRDVGDECDLDYTYVSRIVKGVRRPSRDVLISLCVFAWNLDRYKTDEILLAAGYPTLGRLEHRP